MICNLCGLEIEENKEQYASGKVLCRDCFDDKTYTCEEC